MLSGKFITLEGSEGAGKSTALQFIKKYFAENKIAAVWTREPGGTSLAEEIRSLLLHPKSEEKMAAETEILLMFAARAQHMQSLILPTLTAGQWVVCDRFIDATYAYQGGGRQLDMNFISKLDAMVVGATYPNLTLLLDIPPTVGFERTKGRAGRDRIEQEKIDFFERVRAAYLERAKHDPQRIKIIDASASLATVENNIKKILDEFIRDQ